MLMHNKRLMYTVHVDQTDPRLANLILEQFGGPDGPEVIRSPAPTLVPARRRCYEAGCSVSITPHSRRRKMAQFRTAYRQLCVGALIVLGFATGTPSAHAAAILNLSGEPQRFSLAEQQREVTIPAGEKFWTLGSATFAREGRRVWIDENEEYAIWPDGTFGPQRRFDRHSFHRF